MAKKYIQSKPNYYSVMPADVRYDPNLSSTAKLIYSEIIALCNKEGYCWATNGYFSELFGISKSQVTRIIAQLKKEKYIEIDVNKTQGHLRKIYPIERFLRKVKDPTQKCVYPTQKCVYPPTQKTAEPIENKEVLDDESKPNNTSITSTTFNNISRDILLKDSKGEVKNFTLEPPSNNFFIPKVIKEIISYWNKKGLRRHKDPSTKIYQEIVLALKKLIKGTFFNNKEGFEFYRDRPFKKEDILKSIDNFVASTNLEYKPTKAHVKRVKSTSLLDFLYCDFREGYKSLFIFYLENDPSTPLTAENKYPALVNKIKSLYEKSLGGISPEKYTIEQQRKFIIASVKLKAFYDKVCNKLVTRISVGELAELLYKALVDRYGEGGIEVGSFCSEYTFNKLLPAYLHKQALINN